MSGGSFDVWLLEFSGSPNASEALQRWFGIDAARAERILATMPRPVKRGATALEAEEVAAALRILGAKVEVRPAAPDVKASGTELVRPIRNRATMAGLDSEVDGLAPAPDAPLEPTTDDGSKVPEPRLDLDAPLSGPPPPAPRPVKSSTVGAPRPTAQQSTPQQSAPQQSAPQQPAPRQPAPRQPAAPPPAVSLDPLDPMTAGGEALELADVPEKAEPPKAVTRQGVDAEAVRRIEAQREAEENPEAAKEKARFKLPEFPPWLVRTVVVTLTSGLLLWGLRTAGRTFVASTIPEQPEANTGSLEERTLASGVDVQAFLARPDARLGIDQGRNRALASILRTQGATRVLAADIAQVEGRDVALTLVVELPSSPLRRRRIEAAVEGYEDDRVVDPETVEVPGPEERYLFIDLE